MDQVMFLGPGSVGFLGSADGGGYAGLRLLAAGDGGFHITAVVDARSVEEVASAFDSDDEEPLANVRVGWNPARVLQLWAQRLGSRHLVDLLDEAVRHCPDHVGGAVNVVIDDRSYTVERLHDGMGLYSEVANVTLRGFIANRTNQERWMYVRVVTQPPDDDGA